MVYVMTDYIDTPDNDKHYCRGCEQWKTAASFSRHRGMATGLQPRCKECNRDHYLANRDKRMAQGKAWRAQNLDRAREIQRAYYHRNKPMSKKDERALRFFERTGRDVRGYKNGRPR